MWSNLPDAQACSRADFRCNVLCAINRSVYVHNASNRVFLNPKPQTAATWVPVDCIRYGRAVVTSLLMNSLAETRTGTLIVTLT